MKLKPAAAAALAVSAGSFVTGVGVGLTLNIFDRRGTARRHAAALAEWVAVGLDGWSGDDEQDGCNP